MANEKRLIDADAEIATIKETICKNCNSYNGVQCRACWVDSTIGFIDDAPTVDAVPVEKYNALKERYERMKEIADILDAALRQYQRTYGE